MKKKCKGSMKTRFFKPQRRAKIIKCHFCGRKMRVIYKIPFHYE